MVITLIINNNQKNLCKRFTFWNDGLLNSDASWVSSSTPEGVSSIWNIFTFSRLTEKLTNLTNRYCFLTCKVYNLVFTISNWCRMWFRNRILPSQETRVWWYNYMSSIHRNPNWFKANGFYYETNNRIKLKYLFDIFKWKQNNSFFLTVNYSIYVAANNEAIRIRFIIFISYSENTMILVSIHAHQMIIFCMIKLNL